MQKTITVRLTPAQASDDKAIRNQLASQEGIKPSSISGYYITKHSIDARSKQTWINLSVYVYIDEAFHNREILSFRFNDVHQASKQVIIAGAGPAGLFAALQLIEKGIRPIILERGKDVRARRRDLAILNKQGQINPESNYCFGEGGAGTYSDGKLYTRSSKRGDINRILNLFVHFGAEENILYEAHPHIGTNKLPHIITAIRKQIMQSGGQVLFEKKLTDLVIDKKKVVKVKTADGDSFDGEAFILATGHSARDIFKILHARKILIEAKPFAMGVRVEHTQELIDSIQYRCPVRHPGLPAASYSWVEQVNGKGVFSFCMCPGGIIAPASTSEGELVVNGWSPSKRNNPYANSGIVVTVEEKDWQDYKKKGALAAMYFQQEIERKAFDAGGGKFVAPAQRLIDFTEKKISMNLPRCSYQPGIKSSLLNEVLPSFIHSRLQEGFKATGKKFRGYLTNEAVVVATESRTSSPVRIPRDQESLQHPQLENLFPCGEGAGYAGGIVSAAMDGERVAKMISVQLASG